MYGKLDFICFKSDYTEIKRNKGGLFYILKKDMAGLNWKKTKIMATTKMNAFLHLQRSRIFFGFDKMCGCMNSLKSRISCCF